MRPAFSLEFREGIRIRIQEVFLLEEEKTVL